MYPNGAEVPTWLRSNSQKGEAPTEEPKTPVLRPRKQKDNVMSTMNEDNSFRCNDRKRCKFTEKESEAGELSSIKIAGPKRVLMNEEQQGLTNAIATNKLKTTIPLPMVKEEPKDPDEAINIPSFPEEETKPVIVHYIPKQGSDQLSALCDPPGVPDTSGLTTEMLRAYALAIEAVKNGLKSVLTSAKASDVALMISQANLAFSSLKGLYADCSSFYNVVRSFILHCSQFSAAEKELKENIQAVILVSSHEDFVRRSTEAANAVSNIEAELVKATKYLIPLEARVLEAKQLWDKLEGELGHRRKVVADLEAMKILRVKTLAAVNAKVQGIVVEAEEARTTLKCILHRQETARAAMYGTKAQLSS